MPHSDRRRGSLGFAAVRLLRPAVLTWAVGVLGSASFFAQEQTAEAPIFETRTAFVATPADAPPIVARRQGDEPHGLPVDAVGEIGGKVVADIGAGTGQHLIGLSKRLGPDGHLFATELSQGRLDTMNGKVSENGLENVSVLLATPTEVGLEPGSVDLALLSDVYQFVHLLDGQKDQDKHAFLNSLRTALKPGGEVVVTYVTTDQLRQEDTCSALLSSTAADFAAYGFEVGRRWQVAGPHWPTYVLEFRWPRDGPVSPGEYMGRTIATTMHWRGAEWLTREEREKEEAGSKMLAALGVQPGWTVADFGCGNGYHTLEFARLVGERGKVFGVDIQPEMLELLMERCREASITNVEPLRGGVLDAPLPKASCDLVFLADVYHELSHPVPMLALIRRALKPEGRVVLLEFREEDPAVPIKPLHKMSRKQVVAELEANGFELDESFDELPWQHLLFFRVAEGD